jgi:hypothetical protein
MKTRIGAVILAGMFLAGTASAASAGGPGWGGGRGTAVRSGAGVQNRIGAQQRLRLRDGSCLYGTGGAGSGAVTKRGNTYGSGDGTGPYRPQDGTGYGAPTNR